MIHPRLMDLTGQFEQLASSRNTVYQVVCFHRVRFKGY